MSDLFEAAGRLEAGWPLARRMRPQVLADVVGQEHLTAPGKPLAAVVAAAKRAADGGSTIPVTLPSVVIWGPAGCGKTTLASIVASQSGARFEQVSAVTGGVKDLREVFSRARESLAGGHGRTVLFVDEVHRFSKAQQDALLPVVEDGIVSLIAATTENPSFSLIKPLISRSLVVEVKPLDAHTLRALLDRALTDDRGLAGAVTADDDALDHLSRVAGGDARRSLTLLDAAATLALGDSDSEGRHHIGMRHVEEVASHAITKYDASGDAHYDTASALIKSIRGSDVDAALHYLAVMVAGGEDVAFISRRLMISAAEDIGLADPAALTLAASSHQAVTSIGWPEARIILAEVVVYLALAPKSNASYSAINQALADVKAGRGGPPPAALQGASYAGAADLGRGVGYKYAHDAEHGVAQQQYPPDDLVGVDYYHPTPRGAEGNWAERLASLRSRIRGQ